MTRTQAGGIRDTAITIRLRPEQYDELKRAAAQEDITLSDYVRRELRLSLKLANNSEERIDVLEREIARLKELAGL